MKQIIAGLAFLLFLTGGLSAQTASLDPPKKVKIKEGPEFKSKNTLYSIVGKDGDKFYARMGNVSLMRGSSVSVARFNFNMEMELEKELPMEIEGKSVDYEAMLYTDKGLLLFTSFPNKELGKKYLFRQTIDTKTMEISGSAAKVAEIAIESKKDARTSGFAVVTSPDSSKILVYYDKPYDKKALETFGMHVFDRNLNELWTTDVSIPYTDELFERGGIRVANNGDVFVMGKLFKEKKDRDKDESSYKYLVFEFSEEGLKRTEFDIDLGDKFVNSLIPGVNDLGQLVCGGFYRESRKVGASGSFFVSIDRTTKEMVHKSFKPFDAAFIAEDMRASAAKKVMSKSEKGKDVGISSLVLDRVIKRDDGGLVAIGEQFYITTSTTRDANGRTTTTYIHHYDDIVLVSVDPSGNIEWNAKVPKRQQVSAGSRGGGLTNFLSYGVMVVDASIYLVFNENPKNMMYKGDGKIKPLNLKEPLVVIVEVDSDGRVFKNSLLSKGRGKNVIAQPAISKQIDDNEMVMYMERKKNKSFVFIELGK